MYAMKHGFWYAQRTISALVPRLFPAPVDHAWFTFEHSSDCLLAESPEFGYFDNRVVLLICQINRS